METTQLKVGDTIFIVDKWSRATEKRTNWAVSKIGRKWIPLQKNHLTLLIKKETKCVHFDNRMGEAYSSKEHYQQSQQLIKDKKNMVEHINQSPLSREQIDHIMHYITIKHPQDFIA